MHAFPNLVLPLIKVNAPLKSMNICFPQYHLIWANTQKINTWSNLKHFLVSLFTKLLKMLPQAHLHN